MSGVGAANRILQLGANRGNNSLLSTNTDFRILNTTDEFAIIFICDRAMDIDRFIINIGAWSGTGGNPIYTASLQELDTNGLPDGTALVSDTFEVSAAGLQTGTFSSAYTCAANQRLALHFEDSSGVDSDSYADFRGNGNQFGVGWPISYTSTDSGSSWSKSASTAPYYGVYDSANTAAVMGNPIETPNGNVALINTVGHKSCQQFVLDTVFGRRVKVIGGTVCAYHAGEYKIGIFDSDGNDIVTTGNMDDDAVTATTATQTVYWTPTWLETGVTYYFGLEADEASFMAIQTADLTDNNYLSAYQGYPNNGVYTHNATSWTQVTGEMALISDLLISDWDAHGQEMDHLNVGMNR